MNCLRRSHTCVWQPVQYTPLPLMGVQNWSTSKACPLTESLINGQQNHDLEANDIVSMFALPDVNQVSISIFVARSFELDQVPSLIFTPALDKDTVCIVTTSLDSMSSILGEVLHHLENVEQHFGNSGQPHGRSSSLERLLDIWVLCYKV